MGRLRSIAGIWLVVGACFAPDFPEGAPCGAPSDCPGDLVCDPATNSCRDTCDPRFVLEGTTCVDIDECAANTAGCGGDATCTNTAGSFTCTCNPGFEGDGVACTKICSAVLIFDDCQDTDSNCATIDDTSFADNAAAELGIEVKQGLVGDLPAFNTLFDEGGFQLLIVESALNNIDVESAMKIAAFIDGGGRAIVSFWDLDNANEGAIFRTALEVDTGVTDITTPKPVHPDPAASFDILADMPTPLTFTNPMQDDGDDLALSGAGEILARQDSDDGPGAITLTRDGRALTFGFLPIGLVFQDERDGDLDGIPDAQELYRNAIGHLCGLAPRRQLVPDP